MATHLNKLKLDPKVNEIILELDGQVMLSVLYELKNLHLEDASSGPELVSNMLRNPTKISTRVFYAEELLWLLRTGRNAVVLVSRNYEKFREYISTNPHTPDHIKTSMLGLIDKVLSHDNQRRSN